MGTIVNNIEVWQWGLVIASSVALFFLSPWSKTSAQFFAAQNLNKQPNWFMLTGSLVISWVFAKSIANASDLGNKFGAVGGLAYAAYYLSFIVAGIIIYYMRVKGNLKSIHVFLNERYGRGALQLFSLIIAFRLFNEIWSNTMVIGSYFGERGTTAYYSSILVFTALTLAYTLKGGLRSSIFSDLIQMGLFAVLLTVILSFLMKEESFQFSEIATSGSFSYDGGINLLFAALLQSLSYPFHDPVMTDRAFITQPKVMLWSFIAAGILGGICIFLFSFLGIFGKMQGMEPGSLADYGKIFGPVLLLLINFIMIVSAASTLDSSFASFSKLIAIDLGVGTSVKVGRVTMVIVAVLGSIPIFFNPTVLSATTVSGTMVIGLTPIFLFWWLKAPSLSFYTSVLGGISIGILHAMDLFPNVLIFTEGPYASLLWANIFGVLFCVFLYFLPFGLKLKK
ncbi:sodium:solute symporter family transporter [Lishizhenia sp.]|uniref:sodium:solute symporter family transporter n=1 Tax=Lishizhenia sp. TaxID=2497594 RepID=UPI00299E38E3|nr:sodium:solute symporter [Lishizhenia sp.]MDX1446920.1 sodium:solute symporter [Lishizhenia sp.]